MNKALILKSKKIYRVLLRFYPKKFREEFGDEMQYVFAESLTDAYTEKNDQGFLYFWSQTIADLSKSIVIQHLENSQKGASMKTKNTNNTVRNIYRIFAGTALILMVPLLGMMFNTGFDWTISDFVIIGSLLIGTGLTYELVVKRIISSKYQMVAAVVLVVGLVWLWVELAVGLFTNWGS